jgi:uncharacterized repeat protein (TIGR02543 family)
LTRNSFAGGGFGAVYEHAQVHRTIVRASVETRNNYAGGFAGVIYNAGIVTISAAYGDVTGNRAAGGFVGRLFSSSAQIINAYARGNVTGTHEVGGFIGRFSDSASVRNTFATGIPTASRNREFGGYTGFHLNNSSGTYRGTNFFNTQTSGVTRGIGTSAIGRADTAASRPAGITSAQMLYQPTFENTGWDFDSIWIMTYDYPKFQFASGGGSGTVPANTVLNVMVVDGTDDLGVPIADAQLSIDVDEFYVVDAGSGLFEIELAGIEGDLAVYLTAVADGFADGVVRHYGRDLLELAAADINLIIHLENAVAPSITIISYVEEIERGSYFTFEAEAVNVENVRWEVLGAPDHVTINAETGVLTVGRGAAVGYAFVVRAYHIVGTYNNENVYVFDTRHVEITDIYRDITWEWNNEEGPQSETDNVPGSGGSNNPLIPPTTNPHPPTGTGPNGSDRDYDFDGWAPEGDRNNIWDLDNPPAGDVDVILRPVFTPLFTVEFDTVGGSQVPSQQVRQGGLATRPENPSRTGYVFIGWNNGASPWNFDGQRVNADVTITAVWETAVDLTISASPTNPIFDAREVGYSQIPARTITITNSSVGYVTLEALPNVPNWTLTPGTDWNTPMSPSESRTFTLRPNNGLSVGNYDTTFTVRGNNGASVVISPEFTVTAISRQFVQTIVSTSIHGVDPEEGIRPGEMISIVVQLRNLLPGTMDDVIIRIERSNFLNFGAIGTGVYDVSFGEVINTTSTHVYIRFDRSLAHGADINHNLIFFSLRANSAVPASQLTGPVMAFSVTATGIQR